MNLFEENTERILSREGPLAWRMRPRTLEEFVGQDEILGPGKLLRRAIEADQLISIILYGPPGSGKTTLAEVIAHTTAASFVPVSAVTTGVPEIKEIIRGARERLGQFGRRTILFIDEIHRLNKAQQDVLLPAVENGSVVLIGATTENPYFEVNSALLSRSRLFQLRPLTGEEIKVILRRALDDGERGLAGYSPAVEPEALDHLALMAGGDARVAMNALELAVLSTPPDPAGRRHITLEVAEESIQRRALVYDKTGDQHYDVASAFIKSLRGSDPDAALHYLARMLEAGEDPRFVARRMVILAAEDVGLADPQALLVATAAAHAVEYVGLPEARLPLAEAAIYLATAAKSNSVIMAIDQAQADVHKRDVGRVPVHLRDSNYPGAQKLGHGAGYEYPHHFPDHYVPQQYLPDALKDTVYYRPSPMGYENEIAQRLHNLRKHSPK